MFIIINVMLISQRRYNMLKYENKSFPQHFWNTNKSHLSCWLDTEPFTGRIYSYPLKYEDGTWVVKGIFCSLQCVKRYVIDILCSNPDTLTLFSFMCLKLYGENHVKPSPTFDRLNKFSISNNGLSIEEFRSFNSEPTDVISIQKQTSKKRKVSNKVHRYPAMGMRSIQEHLKPNAVLNLRL